MPDELHRVEWRGNLKGQYRANVMHWRILGATNDTPYDNALQLTSFIHSSIVPLFLDTLPDDYSLDAILVRRIGPTAGNYAAVDYAPLSQPGSRTGPAVSEQLCPCITMIPPMGTKSAGRMFLPAVAKGDINLNVYLAGYITVVNALMAGMVTGGSVAGGTASICVFSRKLNTVSAVLDYHLSPVLGYQRRRARPVGG